MSVDVAIVGGGPAGAIVAGRLAASGHEVVLLERAPAWHWRACGVFASPATLPALREAGLTDAELGTMARPIPAMRLETPGGAHVRLTYGAERAGAPPATAATAATTGRGMAVGFDRRALDERLLDRARLLGADVRRGVTVTAIEIPRAGTAGGDVRVATSTEVSAIRARIVIGADGLRSVVARSAGVVRRAPLGRRVGLTFHVEDPWGDASHDARMIVIDDGYVGLAPVPGGRLNVGIVLGPSWAAALRRDGAGSVSVRILSRLPVEAGPSGSWVPLDEIEGASPLGHRVARRAGAGWLLAGDAAGFLDPFTGEGLHRAVVSAALAAGIVEEALGVGRAGATGRVGVLVDLERYDRAMGRRFGTKDVVSRIVQLVLGRPGLFEYAARRLATRAGVRDTLASVLGDLEPARRALDPRFLGRLLAP